MKRTKLIGLLFAMLNFVRPLFAECGQYTFCNNSLDYYVPENLLRLANKAEEDHRRRFLKALNCRNTSDDRIGRVTCVAGGKEIVWEDERQSFFKEETDLIMVPINEDQAITSQSYCIGSRQAVECNALQ